MVRYMVKYKYPYRYGKGTYFTFRRKFNNG